MINAFNAQDVAKAQERFRSANANIPSDAPVQDIANYLAARESHNKQEALKEALSGSLKNLLIAAGDKVDTHDRKLDAPPYTMGARLNRRFAYDTDKVICALQGSSHVVMVDGKGTHALDYAAPYSVDSDALRAADKASVLTRKDFLVVSARSELDLATVERRINIGGAESRWAEREQGTVKTIDVRDAPRYAAQYLAAGDALKALEQAQQERSDRIKAWMTAYGLFDEQTNRIYSPDRSISMTFHVRDVVDAQRLASWVNQSIASMAIARTAIDPANPLAAEITAEFDAKTTVLASLVKRKPDAKALSEIITDPAALDNLLLAAEKRPYVLSVKKAKTPPQAKAA